MTGSSFSQSLSTFWVFPARSCLLFTFPLQAKEEKAATSPGLGVPGIRKDTDSVCVHPGEEFRVTSVEPPACTRRVPGRPSSLLGMNEQLIPQGSSPCTAFLKCRHSGRAIGSHMGPWDSLPLPGTPSVTSHPFLRERWTPHPRTTRWVPATPTSLSVPGLLEGWVRLFRAADPFWSSLDKSRPPSVGQGHLGGCGGTGQEAGKEDAPKKKPVREAD